jgi:hypothetical protein
MPKDPAANYYLFILSASVVYFTAHVVASVVAAF